jgi:hypothetical protein
VGGNVRRQGLAHDVGEGSGPVGRLRLRRGQNGATTGQKQKLSVHCDLVAQKVDSIDGESEALSLPKAGTGCQYDEGSVPLGNGINDCLHGLSREWFDSFPFDPRQLDADTRARLNQPIRHRRSEYGDEVPINDFNSGRGEGVAKFPDPCLDLGRSDSRQWPMAQERDDMETEIRFHLRCRGWSVNLNRLPLFDVFGQRDSARTRVHVLEREAPSGVRHRARHLPLDCRSMLAMVCPRRRSAE